MPYNFMFIMKCFTQHMGYSVVYFFTIIKQFPFREKVKNAIRNAIKTTR